MLTRLGSVVAVLAMGAAVTACGSSSSSAPSTTAQVGTAKPPAAATEALITESSPYGTIIADGAGRTLYVLSTDTATTSACTGTCAAIWPPLTVPSPPSYASGVNASLVKALLRAGGSHQLTYNGHPLYTFAHDTAAGQTNGQGIHSFGGVWTVISVAGSPVTSSSGSGYGTTTTVKAGY